MRFNRLAPIAALALTVVTTVSAQIPSGARRLGAPAVAARAHRRRTPARARLPVRPRRSPT